ncbi:MAG: proline dehydrogenase family protein [Gemmatimonadota bacterium]|nr:proline dehydrogenase family protein [Gemmatimonadota bacterium]
MAGEPVPPAREGIGTILTCLGERTTTRDVAVAVRDHYLGLYDAILARGLPTQVSVKLTHLGLEVDRDLCAETLHLLAAHAAATGSYLWIDIEESEYVDGTLALYREVRERHPDAGVCLQAYLHRTPDDVEALLPLGPGIRLVKGAYREPPEVAHARKADTDAAYARLAERLLDEGRAFPVFGTHDARLVEHVRRSAVRSGCADGAYEVHMLYGIGEEAQRSLVRQGVPVRVLISYGENWFPWYMRRLAERPANLWFVAKNLLG